MSAVTRYRWFWLGLMILIAAFWGPSPSLILADDDCNLTCGDLTEHNQEQYTECLEKKSQCLQNKISQKKAEANTLQNAINIFNQEINLQQVQISQTLALINQLEKQIAELEERISGLSLSLDRLSEMLVERIQASYKQKRLMPIAHALTFGSLNQVVTQYKYLQQTQNQTAQAMSQAENQRLVYDQQKSLKEVKQADLEEKKRFLQQQRQEIEQKKIDKQKILTETQSDESTYQRLLAEAQREISSLKSFTTSQVGDATCLAGPAGQPDGWYYSQRDSRWCKQRIGKSNEVLGEVGCLISSVAMIWKKAGQSATPSSIASQTDYFSLNTAYMKSPLPAPNGYKYQRFDYRNLKLIDDELSAGRPVIVHLAIGGDGHFVVLKSGSQGDYKMNDPLFGPDLAFTSHYQTGMINSIRIFKPS